MFKLILDKTVKTLKTSIASILILSLIPLIYSLIKKVDILKSIFDFNYVIACIIIFIGLFTLFSPINLKKKHRLVDHSNYGEVMKEEKDNKISSTVDSLLWGISNLVIVGVIEIIIRSNF